jgi:LmbE family N-acetylglucosaminyl deacetylase
MKRVLVISPHPDDESIGCGGTLRKHVLEGDAVEAVFLTSGEKGGHAMAPHEVARRREDEARRAAAILGIGRLEFYHEPDGALSATPLVVERIRARIDEWHPDVIYLPHDQEMHADHRAAVEILRQALRNTPLRPQVLMCEIWTPIQRIDEIVDISSYVEPKRAAICAHESQCAEMDLGDAIIGLNRYRGEMHSWPGGDYAEVFIRMIVK